MAYFKVNVLEDNYYFRLLFIKNFIAKNNVHDESKNYK